MVCDEFRPERTAFPHSRSQLLDSRDGPRHRLVSIVLVFACVLTIPLVIRVMNQGPDAAAGMDLNVPLWLELTVDLALVLAVVLIWRRWQTTPGKRLFQLKIVDSRTGGRPGFGWLVARYLGYLVAILPVIPFRQIAPFLQEDPMIGPLLQGWTGWLVGIPLGFGYLWILIDRRNRGLHDLLSRTVTVQANFGGNRRQEEE